MKSASTRQLARWGAGAIVLLLLQGFCAPCSARAGCNHLVSSRSDRMIDLGRLDDLIAGGNTQGRPAPERREVPCSGMSCSSPIPFPPSTANPLGERSDQWGALTTIAVLPPTFPNGRTTDEPAPRGSIDKASIFHPPRV